MASPSGGPGDTDDDIPVTDRRSFTRDGERRRADVDAPGEPAEREEAPSGPTPVSPTFETLVHAFAIQASLFLGEIEDPTGAEPKVDLAAAREMIDLLGVLREKTTGNLSGEEQELLDGWLSRLRFRYAEKVRPR